MNLFFCKSPWIIRFVFVLVLSMYFGYGSIVLANDKPRLSQSHKQNAEQGDSSHYTCPMHPSVESAGPGSCSICGMNLTQVKKVKLPQATKIETHTHDHSDPTPEVTTATAGGISHYTCSMHSSVKSAIPGTCPICAMDLVPVTKQEMQSGSIHMDARRRQLIGVTLGVAEEKHLVQTIRAAGRIAYDETLLTDITLKFDGWIGKLTANHLGAQISKGQALFTVYSPDLLSTQEEYLQTRQRLKGQHSRLLTAAQQRLILWDITPAQIRQLEKLGHAEKYFPILAPVNGAVIEKNIVTGSAVKAGQKLLRIADLSKVWVEGQIYEYEIPQVKVGMDVEVVLSNLPGKTMLGKLAYVSPYLESDTHTAKVRVELDNADGLLRPGMFAQLQLNIDLGKRLVVPEGAVLYAGESRVVFVDLGNGRLQARKIKTGLRNADDIEVLEGLSPGDKVVTSGNFLIAAESKLKAGINQW